MITSWTPLVALEKLGQLAVAEGHCNCPHAMLASCAADFSDRELPPPAELLMRRSRAAGGLYGMNFWPYWTAGKRNILKIEK